MINLTRRGMKIGPYLCGQAAGQITNNIILGEMKEILRKLLIDGGIVTVQFDKMREIQKELDRFCVPIEIEILKSDFDTVSFRVLDY